MTLALVPKLPMPQDTQQSGVPGTYKLNSLDLAFPFASPCWSAEKRRVALFPPGPGLHNQPLAVRGEAAREWGF